MKLTADRLRDASYMRNIFAVTPEHGTTLEDIKEPAYWAHTAAKLHPTDRIEVTAEDGSWFAELFVASCGRNWAKVSVLRYHELSESSPTDAAVESSAEGLENDFYVLWRGQTHQHCVMRAEDKAVVKTGFTSKKDAQDWIDQHVKMLAASS